MVAWHAMSDTGTVVLDGSVLKPSSTKSKTRPVVGDSSSKRVPSLRGVETEANWTAPLELAEACALSEAAPALTDAEEASPVRLTRASLMPVIAE